MSVVSGLEMVIGTHTKQGSILQINVTGVHIFGLFVKII